MLSLLKRVLGLEPRTPPVLSPEELKAKREEIAEWMARDVANGFMSIDYVRELSIDLFTDDLGEAAAIREVDSILPAVVAAHRDAQRDWPKVTDCDRLDIAFAELEAEGILARQNFSCCGTCGAGEISDEMDEAQKHGNNVRGYTFYHQQDTESAVEGGGVFLAYGSNERSKASALSVAREVFAKLKSHGFEPEWNGKVNQRIQVPLDWKKRSELIA